MVGRSTERLCSTERPDHKHTIQYVYNKCAGEKVTMALIN